MLDVSKNFTNQDTFPYTSLLKGPDVPNTLIENALWYSSATRKIYQLGGWFSFNNNNNAGYYQDSQIPSSAIWQFDIDTQTWSKATTDFDLVNTGSKIDRPGAAAYCDAPTLNRSFIFEGYVQHRSDPDYVNYTQSADFKCEICRCELLVNLKTDQRTSLQFSRECYLLIPPLPSRDLCCPTFRFRPTSDLA